MDADPRDALIEQLQTENARLRAENTGLRAEQARLLADHAQLRETIRRLEQRLEELERQAHRSAAPFRREERKKKPPVKTALEGFTDEDVYAQVESLKGGAG